MHQRLRSLRFAARTVGSVRANFVSSVNFCPNLVPATHRTNTFGPSGCWTRGGKTMLMRRVSAKEKFNNGPVRAALVAGVASAVAVGSLSGVGPASGTCIGFSGFDFNLGGGGGCTSTFGNFALGLGEG